MAKQLQISGKNLGALALDDFCEKCLWIKIRVHDELPFQIWPGIFSSIDSYTKKVVHGWFDKNGSHPKWLDSLGSFTGYIDPPHHSKFWIIDDDYGIKVTGAPDGILVRDDKSLCIVDYKTAKFTAAQDDLLPMYEVQLNVYAKITEGTKIGKVSKLGLIYMEPFTELSDEPTYFDKGFYMQFHAQILEVKLNLGMIKPLLARFKKIHEASVAPKGLKDCKDCDALSGLLKHCS